MDNNQHNIYTISDSDNDSIIVESGPNNSTLDNSPSSPGEPEFFRQVLKNQKHLISVSPELNFHHKKNLPISETPPPPNYSDDDDVCMIVDHLEPNINVKGTKQRKRKNIESNDVQASDILAIHNILEIPKKRRLTKDEQEKKKQEELSRKNEKKKITEALKRIKPTECIKYITVHIDTNLQNCEFGQQILIDLQSMESKYKCELNPNASYSVTWSRNISDNVDENENFMLLIWDFDRIKDLISSDRLIESINNLKMYRNHISLIVYGSAEEFKKCKSRKKGTFTKSVMLIGLQKMMLSCSVTFRLVETKNEIGSTIVNFTKAVAQKPFKVNKFNEELEGCEWYATGHSKNCVSVDKNGTGLNQLWRQQLSQFPLCSLEASEAIATVYKTPTLLLEAYEKCSSRMEGELLLQDIPVRRGYGPLVATRRVGPELSKKIYLFFMDDTGQALLSQE
ncbi:crossover junction endonuclease EME1 [Adelges cooleyi]|uniref:crossover junction endonuclease EME1 n=1 Tax=Adelges cooleyi TaxID=133065 RepID=UPI00217F7DAD|nr:crossover junction endonuclease EME1 [Adelges cooleyi]